MINFIRCKFAPNILSTDKDFVYAVPEIAKRIGIYLDIFTLASSSSRKLNKYISGTWTAFSARYL